MNGFHACVALFLIVTGFMAGTIYSTGMPYGQCHALPSFDEYLSQYGVRA